MEPLAISPKRIVVGLLTQDDTGSLAYALKRALVEPSEVRQVRAVIQGGRGPSAQDPLGVIDIVGEPGEVLLEESRMAKVMVVQTPSDAASALDDPVLSRLRRSADCLLVEVNDTGQIVRASGPHGSSGAQPGSLPLEGLRALTEIVVGFDASASSVEAVRWAIAWAQEDAMTVQVVMAYRPVDETDDRSCEEAMARLAAGVELLKPGRVTVIQRVVAGEPTDVLLNCSNGSRLLVLGRHGTSGMIHNALGSVGDTCARLASCPVVIVPARAADAA
ncbi:MAG: universal stress protein [Aeromicrobium sp.]